MGKKDLWQIDYFGDKGRFADMFNGILFDGKTIIKEEELEEADSKLVYHEKSGESVSVIRDKVYKWKEQHVSICVLENQSYVDYRMVFRVMLEEAAQAIFGILDIKGDIDKYKEKTEKGERVNMCKAWDDHIERGRREGRQEALEENLKCIMKNMKITVQQAMDILEIPETERSLYASIPFPVCFSSEIP